MSVAHIPQQAPRYLPGSIVFGSGTSTPFIIGKNGRSCPIVDGWYLDTFEHDDDDVFKVEYEAVNHKTGQHVSLNWSPYESYTDAHFEAMVAMGFPKGVALPAPAVGYRLYPYDVDNLYRAHLAALSKHRAA